MISEHLFVYGTLQKDLDNDMSRFLGQHSEFLGRGYFFGKLFEISWFPGAESDVSNSSKVYGSVFKLKDTSNVFKTLDTYEGYNPNDLVNSLFRRESITVYFEDNTSLTAWVYLYNRSTANEKQIVSGDYMNKEDSAFTGSCFHPIELEEPVELPEKFTFPFYYEPHILSVLAAKNLQAYLETQGDFKHNFGLDPDMEGLQIGKMFGVMVVKNGLGKLGYLAAFSGKLAESNNHKGFVPTVYDTLNPSGFYKQGEIRLNELNAQIDRLENAPELSGAKTELLESESAFELRLENFKAKIKANKQHRKTKRNTLKSVLPEAEYQALLEDLRQESIHDHFRLKDLKVSWNLEKEKLERSLNKLVKPIEDLKELRATQSAQLQKQLHEQYNFLNAKGETKGLLDIFRDRATPIPPAGSGECAAPKLFQYAFENKLKPIAMAEFWWGASPKSMVRKHRQFYPSCRSKCEPILGHMMQGLNVEDNPILEVKTIKKPLEIVYEDDYLLLVNKPHEFLSVPGKTIEDSVLAKMQQYLPNSTGPLLVHRLDMSTSGLLLVAKNEKTHKNLQKQFIKRTIKKRYVALLDGIIEKRQGEINLPLRVDLDNRPQQLVCFEHGKTAKTRYEVVSIKNGKTRIHFYPITGRTHQLRVHAAHADGLNAPIIGDDLYGKKEERLYLHAEYINFEHPITKKRLEIVCNAPF